MTAMQAGRRMAALLALVLLPTLPLWSAEMTNVEDMFASAQKDNRVGVARKSMPVDARSAEVGEQIVTMIAGEGKETQSKPAEAGDMVVRNRCEATGHEEYLVKADTFAKKYEGPLGAAETGVWRPYRPRGTDMLYFVVRDQDGSFSFLAPWGEAMVARPGDAIVRDPSKLSDIYRVARDAFTCTYELIREPPTK